MPAIEIFGKLPPFQSHSHIPFPGTRCLKRLFPRESQFDCHEVFSIESMCFQWITNFGFWYANYYSHPM